MVFIFLVYNLPLIHIVAGWFAKTSITLKFYTRHQNNFWSGYSILLIFSQKNIRDNVCEVVYVTN